MIYRILICAVLFLTLPSLTNGQSKREQKFPSSVLLKDLEFVKTSLNGLHPGTNRFGQGAEFETAYKNALLDLKNHDSLSVQDFFRIVNPYIVSLRCGHTKFMPWVKNFPFFFHSNEVLPVIVRFDDTGNLLVIKSTKKETIGKYLHALNGSPIKTVVENLKSQMLADGFVQSSALAQIEQYFSAWYGDFILESDRFKVELIDEKGTKEEVLMNGIDVKDWLILNRNTSFLKQQNVLETPSDSVAYLRIATFNPQQGNKQFERFLDSSFAIIRQKRTQNLIIDLRDNEGGTDKLGKKLYAYIAQKEFLYYDRIEVRVRRKKDVPNGKFAYFPKFIGLARLFTNKTNDGKLLFKKHANLGLHKPEKNSFTGKVWFLANGLSYSVSSEFLAVAKDENRGVFAGTESGGAYQGNNSGTFVIFKMPTTKLDLGIPVAAYYSAVKPETEIGRGVMPDKEILPRRSDLLENQDTVLQLVLSQIGKY
jgi:hypothetical protein